MKNRTENISVRYRPQHLTKSRNKLVLKKKRKLLFFVIPTVLKDTSGKDLNHEGPKGVTKLAKGVRESP